MSEYDRTASDATIEFLTEVADLLDVLAEQRFGQAEIDEVWPPAAEKLPQFSGV